MAKVMIEVDIPAGRSIAEAKQAVAMCFDENWMAEYWHIDDVIEQAQNNGEQVTEEEARKVLQLMDKNHDCEIGINWDVIDGWVDFVVSQRANEKAEYEEER
jgi:hypothetical protein